VFESESSTKGKPNVFIIDHAASLIDEDSHIIETPTRSMLTDIQNKVHMLAKANTELADSAKLHQNIQDLQHQIEVQMKTERELLASNEEIFHKFQNVEKDLVHYKSMYKEAKHEKASLEKEVLK
jgi:oligoendopeptidase F